MACRMLAGLEVLHSAGYLHRDIALRNILCVERPGKDRLLKIADLGLCCTVEEASTAQGWNSHSAHTAPEVLEVLHSDKRLDPAKYSTQADLWAIGVILVELLTLSDVDNDYYYDINAAVRIKKLMDECREHPEF